MKLNDLFEPKNGLSSADVSISLRKTKTFNVPYIRPSSNYSNLVAGYVDKTKVPSSNLFPKNTLFVSTDGQGSHTYAYVSPVEFVPNSNVLALIPKVEMELQEKIFYAMAITANRWRFSYGRKPKGERFTTINVPSKAEIPKWVHGHSINIDDVSGSIGKPTIPLNPTKWAVFEYPCLFEIRKGKRLTKANMTDGKTPFIGSIDDNNGYREYIGEEPNHTGNTITINYNGSVGEAFYQPRPFWASDDVNVLYPRFTLNKYIAFFLITLMQKEKFRFSYGRKWELERMNASTIKLPVTDKGEPDWQFMEGYIKSLPYSSNL
jgi:hypothetical protein